MNQDIAIKVDQVSKSFKIPHENRNTIRERIISVRKKTTYEKFDALNDVSFEIKKGEFFGIIGRNGSGKSTLLKILAGIYTPDSGSVQVNGEISPFLELGVGFNPELSGKDNIYLNGTILGLTKKEIDKKYDKIVGFSELERFINLKVKNYSSGMHVRLAFSVAIHANKEILLMDEVLAVGDANFQAKCISEFLDYRRQKKTVVFVTHDIGTAQKYCDRFMLIRDGQVAMIGNPGDVAAEYITQNMTDEERRLINEAKNKVPDEGSADQSDSKDQETINVDLRKVKLDKVEFLNDSCEPCSVFKTGDNLIIRVYFSNIGKVEKLNFGIAIFSQEDYGIFGINTFIDRVDTQKFIKNGYFEVRYNQIALGTNKYYIKSGVWEDKEEHLVDFMHRSKENFQVQSFSRNEGIVHLDYEWLT